MKDFRFYFSIFLFISLLISPSVSHSQSSLQIISFEMISNGNGLIEDNAGFDVTTQPYYGAYSADWYRDVLWGDGSILDLSNGMQAAGGWYFITAGSNSIQNYDDALGRWTRNGRNDDVASGNTYEIRFTESGGKAIMAFTSETLVDVPFELWRIPGIPDQDGAEVRMIPWLYDDDGDDVFNFKLDHQADEDDDDPYSDWIYFILPEDDSPGQSGYEKFVQDAENGAYDFGGQEHLARVVIMNWDQHQNESVPGESDGPVNAMPEPGTIFRINVEISPQSSLQIRSFEMISNGNGLIEDTVGFDATRRPNYGAYSTDWYRDVLWGGGSILGLPGGMQAAGGWYFITAGPGYTRDYNYAVAHWTRNGTNDVILEGNTYEIRFTENGGKAWMAWTSKQLVDVPFELWRVPRIPNQAAGEVRMIPWVFDEDGNDVFNFKLDHQADEDNNDPYSDWIYFIMPDDDAPGQSGYDYFVSDPMNCGGQEHIARLALMNWNRHQNESAPGSGDGTVEAMPETGTVFKIAFVAKDISIDIKPGNDLNSINCEKSKGNVSVAVLTTDELDAMQIDVPTVVFGPGRAPAEQNKEYIEDVDGDGDQDRVFHFRLPDTGILSDDTNPILSGQTLKGLIFAGSDQIRCVPLCEKKIDDPGLHDKNQVKLLIAPDGRIARNDEVDGYGFFPKNSCDRHIFTAGASVGGIVDGNPVVAQAFFNSEFVPSEIGNTGVPFRVFNSSDSKDKKNWPPEFSLSNGKAIIVSKAQNLVVQYNDVDGPQNGDQDIPLGVEIRQRSLAFNDPTLQNALIFIWEITNISAAIIENAVFGFWCDPDVGNMNSASDDRTSFVSDMAITWDSDFNEYNFKQQPAIVGFDFLETPGDQGVLNYTAFVNGGPNQEPNQDAVQYSFMSGTNHFETDLTRDIRMLLSAHLHTLQVGEIAVVAGALLFGGVPEGTTSLATGPDYPFRPDPSDPALADLLNTQQNVRQYYNQNLKGTGLPKDAGILPAALPEKFTLHQNYPNPFNPETEIRFELPMNGNVVVKVYNTLGQEISTLADGYFQAGYHRVRWDGSDNSGNRLASGIYIYRIKAEDFVDVKKMVIMR